jgi:hypothetical protein
MPISPEQYVRRAEELEELAATITDEPIKNGYLELAAELRRMAVQPPPMPEHSDAEVQQLAERMVGQTVSKL